MTDLAVTKLVYLTTYAYWWSFVIDYEYLCKACMGVVAALTCFLKMYLIYIFIRSYEIQIDCHSVKIAKKYQREGRSKNSSKFVIEWNNKDKRIIRIKKKYVTVFSWKKKI